jgi:hypothetical protein
LNGLIKATKAILIVVFSLIVAGALLIWGSSFTLLRASLGHGARIEPPVFYMSMITLLLGVVSLTAAWSLMKGKHWARLVIITLSIVSIFVSILSISNSNFGSAVTLFIYSYVIYLMNTRSVKDYLQ